MELEVAFYCKKHAEISYKQRRKKGGKSGLEAEKRSQETTRTNPRAFVFGQILRGASQSSEETEISGQVTLSLRLSSIADQMAIQTPTSQDCFEDERKLGYETCK